MNIIQMLIGVFLSACIVVGIPFLWSKIRIMSIIKDIVNKHAFNVSKKISVCFGRYIVLFDYINHKFALVEEYGYKATVCSFKNIKDLEEIKKQINPLYFSEFSLKIKTVKKDLSINFIDSKTKIFSHKDNRARRKCIEISRELANVRAWQIKNKITN